MKKNLIKTGIVPPAFIYHEPDRSARRNFIDQLAAALELPENWSEYFKINSTHKYFVVEDYITGGKEFRKMYMRGREVVINPIHIQEAKEYVDKQNERRLKQDEKRIYAERMRKLLNPIFQSTDTSDIHSLYDAGTHCIEVRLRENGEEENTMGVRVSILKNKTITTPLFYIGAFKTYLSIEEAKLFIKKNEDNDRRILRFAENLMSMLPEEFFTS